MPSKKKPEAKKSKKRESRPRIILECDVPISQIECPALDAFIAEWVREVATKRRIEAD